MQLYCRQPVVQPRTLEPILFLYIRHSIEPLVLFNRQYYFIWQLLILLHVHSQCTYIEECTQVELTQLTPRTSSYPCNVW